MGKGVGYRDERSREELIATHPLKAADVVVSEIEDNPGFFCESLSDAAFSD